MTLAFLATSLLALAPADASELQQCRALDKAFDTKGLVVPCGAAGADESLAPAERVEALRRLALAHILNGDDVLAGAAFLDMLTLDPAAELPADVNPRVRALFDAVKQRHGGPAARRRQPASALTDIPTPPEDTAETEALVVAAPAVAVAAPAPSWVPSLGATGIVAGVGLAALGGLTLLVAGENEKEWSLRAEGKTFPRDEDDPRCADSCEEGWTQGYGPAGEDNLTGRPTVGQGARFFMVAVSAKNAEGWRTSQAFAGAFVAVGIAATVAGVVVVAAWPGE